MADSDSVDQILSQYGNPAPDEVDSVLLQFGKTVGASKKKKPQEPYIPGYGSPSDLKKQGAMVASDMDAAGSGLMGSGNALAGPESQNGGTGILSKAHEFAKSQMRPGGLMSTGGGPLSPTDVELPEFGKRGAGSITPVSGPIELAAGMLGAKVGKGLVDRGIGGRPGLINEPAPPPSVEVRPEMPAPINIAEGPTQPPVSSSGEPIQTQAATPAAPPEPISGLGPKAAYAPEHQTLMSAADRNPDIKEMLAPVHEEMFKNPQRTLKVKQLADANPENKIVQAFRQQNDLIKNKAMAEQEKFINQSAGGAASNNDVAAGDKVLGSLKSAFKNHEKEASQLFGQLDQVSLPSGQIPQDLGKSMMSEVPGMNKVISINDQGKFVMKPYDMTSGASKKTYSDLKDVLTVFNKKDATFSDLQKARGVLREMRTEKNERMGKMIGSLYDQWGNYMDNLAEAYGPQDANYKAARQAWAQHKDSLKEVEGYFGPLTEPKLASEKVLQKTFSDTKVANAVKDVVGDDQFRKMGADYLAMIKRDSAQAVSSRKNAFPFAKALKDNSDTLSLAFKPEELQRLRDLSSTEGLVGDLGSSNPSGSGLSVIAQGKTPIQHVLDVANKGYMSKAKEVGEGLLHKVIGQKAKDKEIEAIIGRGEFGPESAGPQENMTGLLFKGKK